MPSISSVQLSIPYMYTYEDLQRPLRLIYLIIIVLGASILTVRSCYSDANGNVVCNDSAWDRWIRWLVLGLIVAAALILFFLFS